MATEAATTQRLGLAARLPLRKIVVWTLSILIILGVVLGTRSTLAAGIYSADDWTSFIIQGIAQGSLYALIAMGYTLVYGILFMINFAHGEIFMAGAFTSFFMARTLDDTGFYNSNPIISILILLAVSCGVSVLTAVLLERIAYRPLRGAPRLVPLITAIGASLFLQNTFRGLYGARVFGYPRPAPLDGTWNLFGTDVLKVHVISIIGALILVVLLYMFITRTKTGRSMRAVGEDKEIASLMGINVDRIIVTTFVLGGALAGAAGVLWALVFRQVNFFMGFFPGIKAFTAAVLGGIGNVIGAALGGLALGILEALVPTLLLTGPGVPSPLQLKDAVAFTVLVLVLIFRPGGILGSTEEEKA
ncbi:MAG: branched-chain amino acid ABC transporter permease [Actinomycetota bacterium]|nr:branched-chain amino acid ABC transporter permease [Actinomycetota bacterium]